MGIERPTKCLKRRYLKGPQLLDPPLLKVTKNLVTFKRKDSVKDKKLNVFGNQWKIRLLRGEGGGGVHKKTI